MQLSKQSKDFASFFLRVLFSLIGLFIVYKIIDIDATIDVLKNADFSYILIAGVIFLVINIILLIRWLIFIRALGLSSSRLNVARSYFLGLFGNLFLPSAIGGDILKTIGLCLEEPDKKAKVVASVLIDRLSGFASIVIVSVCAFIVGYKHIQDNNLLIPIVIMAAGAFFIALVLFTENIYSFCCRIFGNFPKIRNNLMKLHYDIALLKGKQLEALKGIGMSCLSQVIFATVFFFLAKALHQDVRLIYCLIFVPMICIASLVPSIGGLGVRELGAVYLFSKIGLVEGVSASLSLMTFFFMVIVGLLGGLFYVLTVSSGRVQYSAQDRSPSAFES